MKSRILWLSYGDGNTHFFHVQAKIKRACQHIATLKDDFEEWLRGSDLHNHVTTHFQCLFQSGLSGALLPPPQMLFSSSDFDPQALCDTFIHFLNKEEIRATLFTMHPIKNLRDRMVSMPIFINAIGRLWVRILQNSFKHCFSQHVFQKT